MNRKLKIRLKSFLLAALLMISGCMAAMPNVLTAHADDADGGKEIIVQVGSDGYKETGDGWSTSNAYCSNDGTTKTRYCYKKGATATWTAAIAETGTYEVYIWRVNGAYASSLNLYYTGGTTQVVNWKEPQGEGWIVLGDAEYIANQEVTVTMSNPSGGDLRPAAVKFVQKTSDSDPSKEKLIVYATDGEKYYKELSGTWSESSMVGLGGKKTRYSDTRGASVEWKPMVAQEDKYRVCLYRTINSADKENKVKIELFNAAGVSLSVREAAWTGTDAEDCIDLGTYDLNAGQITVRVTQLTSKGTPILRANAVELVPVTDEATEDYAVKINGASVKTDGSLDIRFEMEWNTAFTYGTIEKVGLVLIPTMYLSDGQELTIDEDAEYSGKKAKSAEKTITASDGNLVYVNLKSSSMEKYLNTAYTARAYVKLTDGTVLYSYNTIEQNNIHSGMSSRSCRDVAKAVAEKVGYDSNGEVAGILEKDNWTLDEYRMVIESNNKYLSNSN